MYLFIFESIGTSELLLIGVIALIVFGPRKLPEMARMLGKTMADFRKTTNEFKSTWEKEANFDEPETQSQSHIENPKPVEQTVQRETKQLTEQNSILSPEIKEIDSSKMNEFLELNNQNKEATETTPKAEPQANDKRSWL